MSIKDVVEAINEGSSSEEILQLLDEFHLDVDEPEGELRLRIIHHAVFKDRLDCVKLFLKRGCDIEGRDQCGFTPLHIAARYNRAEMANELITLGGAQVDAHDSLGCTPLHMALHKGHKECAEVLLQHGAEPNTHYSSIGYEIHALPGLHSDCLELLLSYGADPDVRDTKGLTPLHHATRSGNTLYVYILLRNGANPDALTQPGNPERVGQTALQMAVFNDSNVSKGIIELLLVYGADVNCKDEHRNTPLHHIARSGKIEIAKLLIEHGAVLTARNTLRYHPLHTACVSNPEPEMMKLLLDNGAFVNSTTSLLDTPLKCLLAYWKEITGEVNNNDSNTTAADEMVSTWREQDGRCALQILTLLDRGARVTVNNSSLDPFSVLNVLPPVSRMPRARDLLLQSSRHTCLRDHEGKVPEKYVTTEYLDVSAAASNPLSLRQACRVAIRHTLGRMDLPEAVKTLQLPSILEGYLLFRTP